MRLRPSRLFFLLLLLCVATNGAWLYAYYNQTHAVEARDEALMQSERAMAQFAKLATASLGGRPLKEVEPALQKIFKGIPTEITKDPRTYIIGDVVLILDAKDTITSVATFAP